ncbi:DUF239-domain-containing protein [Stipitochalara longipes BDJ]|nr:DUF239-domain-containing protein [Stipitochalara longipes BDJ]
MSYVTLKTFFVLPLLAGFFAETLSTPAPFPNQYVEHALKKRQNHNVVETTHTQANTLDWIPLTSQGKIAKAPPLPSALPQDPSKKVARPVSELEMPGIKKGPAGTVPVPRVNATYLTNVCQKKPPPNKSGKTKRQDAGDHWYVNADQVVNNHGSNLVMSMFAPFVNNAADFSLLQTAVTAQTSAGMQTVEAGWLVYPSQVSQPHIFTYFTTNGYASTGNNIGGWNQDVSGWVQTDSTYFPGTAFSTISTINGTQYDMTMQYQLYEGNWWLLVIDRFIGYYPGSLFSAATKGSASLANQSDTIYYYGEIAQSEGPVTNSDMGSGDFAETGFGNSGYMHNMYYLDTNGNSFDFNASFSDSDASRYDHRAFPSSGTAWGSYLYLGGPGAGGVVGG